MIKLIVNDIQLELSDSNIIALTKQSNDIFDFNNKRSNLSNTIKVPVCPVNDLALGYAYDLASTSVVRNWLSALLIQDYEEIISEGKCKLLGKEGKFYLIGIYWGNIDLSARIGEKTLRDLDLEDLDHDWDLVNVSRPNFGSHPTISGRDLNYPILNTHETEELRSGVDSSNYLYAARLVPFVSLSRILKQIAIDNDLTFEGIDEFLYPAALTDINEHVQNDYWIPVSNRQPAFNFEDKDIINTIANSFNITAATLATDPAAPPLLFYNSLEVLEDFIYPESGTFNFDLTAKLNVKGSVSDGSFNYKFLVYPMFSSDGGLTFTNNFANRVAAYIAYLNGTIEDGNNLVTGLIEAGTDIDFDLDIDVSFSRLGTAGDIMIWKAVPLFAISGTADINIVVTNTVGSNYGINKDIINFGDEYTVGINLPDIKQLDILKFVAAITNSLVDIEDGTNNVIFTKFEDVANSVITTQDYSDKVETVKIKSYHPKLSQNNYLNYDNDNEVDETLAQGNLQITGNDTLKQSSEFYKAPFSASGNESWLYANSIDMEIGRYPIIKVWNEVFNSVKGRIFRLKPQATSIYIGTSGDPTNQAAAKFVAYFANLQYFSELGYLSNYLDYKAMMEDYKACEVLANMTGTDFKAINLYKSLYIEQEGAYFFILSVNEFIQGKKTKLSLLKL